MHNYMDDLCMVVIIIGCIVLLLCRIDGEVKSILTMSAAYFFLRSYGKIKSGGK